MRRARVDSSAPPPSVAFLTPDDDITLQNAQETLEEWKALVLNHDDSINACSSATEAAEYSVAQIKKHFLLIQQAVDYRVQNPFQPPPPTSPHGLLYSLYHHRSDPSAAPRSLSSTTSSDPSLESNRGSVSPSISSASGPNHSNRTTVAELPVHFSDFERVRLAHIFGELKMHIQRANESVRTIVSPVVPATTATVSQQHTIPTNPPRCTSGWIAEQHPWQEDMPTSVCRPDNPAQHMFNQRSSPHCSSGGHSSRWSGSRRGENSSSTSARPPLPAAAVAARSLPSYLLAYLHHPVPSRFTPKTVGISHESVGARTTSGSGGPQTTGSCPGARQVQSTSQNTTPQNQREQFLSSGSSAASLCSHPGAGLSDGEAYFRSVGLMRRPKRLTVPVDVTLPTVSPYYQACSYSMSVGGGGPSGTQSDSPHSSVSALRFKRVVSLLSETLTSTTGNELGGGGCMEPVSMVTEAGAPGKVISSPSSHNSAADGGGGADTARPYSCSSNSTMSSQSHISVSYPTFTSPAVGPPPVSSTVTSSPSQPPYDVDDDRVDEYLRCLDLLAASVDGFSESDFNAMNLRCYIPGIAATSPANTHAFGTVPVEGDISGSHTVCSVARDTMSSAGDVANPLDSDMFLNLFPHGEKRLVRLEEFPEFRALVMQRIEAVERAIGRPIRRSGAPPPREGTIPPAE